MQSLSSQSSRRLLTTTSTRPSGSFLQPGIQTDGSTPDWHQQQLQQLQQRRRQRQRHAILCSTAVLRLWGR
jgi:hypothetical protein